MPSPQPRFYLWPKVTLSTSGGCLDPDPAKVRFDLRISLIIDGLFTEKKGVLEPDSRLSLRGLNKLLDPPSEAFLYTCSCGDAGCGGYWKPVRSDIQKTEFSRYFRFDDFRFGYRNYQGAMIDTPETVFFLVRDICDLVSSIAITIQDLAKKHPGQLSGEYDTDLQSFLSDYLGEPVPAPYIESTQ